MAFLNMVMPTVALLVVCFLFTIPAIWGLAFGLSLAGTVLGILEKQWVKMRSAKKQKISSVQQPEPAGALSFADKGWVIKAVGPLMLVIVPITIAAGVAIFSFRSYQAPLQIVESVPPPAPVSTTAVPFSSIDGESVYNTNCAVCHQANGAGIAAVYPPLAGSEWVVGDPAVLVKIVHNGLNGPIVVKGETYNNVMSAFGAALSAGEIAAAINFVRSSWGNEAEPIDDVFVDEVIATLGGDTATINAADLPQP